MDLNTERTHSSRFPPFTMCNTDSFIASPSNHPSHQPYGSILQTSRSHGDGTRMRSKPQCLLQMVASTGFLLLIVGCLVVVVGGGRRPRGPAGLIGLFIISTGFSFLMVCCIWGYCFRKHPNRVNVEETSGINHTSHMFTPPSSSSDENYTVSTRFGAQTAPIRVLSHDGAVILLPRDAAAGGGGRSFSYHYGNEMTGLREGVHYNARYNAISLPSYDQAMSCPVLLSTSSTQHPPHSPSSQHSTTQSAAGYTVDASSSTAQRSEEGFMRRSVNGTNEPEALQTSGVDFPMQTDQSERITSGSLSDSIRSPIPPYLPLSPPQPPPPPYQPLSQ